MEEELMDQGVNAEELHTQTNGPECLQKQANELWSQCTGADGLETVCKEVKWCARKPRNLYR